MKLKNELYANSKLVSGFGELVFDEKGILVLPELTEEQLKSLAELKGFELEATEEVEKPKEVEKVEEPKEEEVKAEEPTEEVKEEVKEEAPKKKTRKKKED